MAEKFVSPGVFTRENDSSFLPQGISEIGTAVVGTFSKGPAFVPTVVSSVDEFRKRFGGESEKHYASYAVKNVLANSNTVTVVRVGESGGYIATGSLITATEGGETASVILAPTRGDTDLQFDDVSFTGTVSSATINVEGNNYSVSFDPTAENYVTKVFGTDPLGTKDAYVYAHTPTAFSSIINSEPTTAVTGNEKVLDFGSQDASSASTPFIKSQNISNTEYNMFKFVTLNTGTDTNREVKVSIQNVKRASEINDTYGRFDVVVRDFNDTDTLPVVLETFSGCSMNPSSPNFIGRKIGDRYWTVDVNGNLTPNGDYVNNSQYIRVELAPDYETFPTTIVPGGFDSYFKPLSDASISDIPLKTDGAEVTGSTKTHFGVDFDGTKDALLYFTPVPNDVTQKSSTFSLPSTLFAADSTSSIDQRNRRFTVGFQGGFDGGNPNTVPDIGLGVTSSGNVNGLDLANSASSGTKSFVKALNTISNPLEFDYNVLLTPGVSHDYGQVVVERAKEIVEDRADAFYIADLAWIGQSNNDAIVQANQYNSSYMATYYPWVKIVDSSTTKPIWVPPSVVMGGVYAFNDTIAAEWFAPAGLNRGNITQAIDVYKRLKRSDLDELYDNKVNPIVSFPAQGIVAYGQKTLQTATTALDRVNVRRLLINLKKFVSSTSRFLVFENNTDVTRNRFLSLVEPYLDSVQQNQGLFAYRVVIDETNNTPDVIDRNQLVGQFYIQPARAAEFIVLDFNVLPTGAEFPQ